ncbi:hypothetical protein C5167_015008 [Papaver somniferum]|uniref:Rx N-terminal domain-containing protein n=1 Tax=Papaver somniferum TaxID=3469 RepID=A0A4Y7J7X3_PAPSO|nr:hypothetical protein C5167_015008 [Papaver somniferum]
METQRILGAPASQALIDNLISSTSDPIFVSVKFDMKKISDTLSSIRDVLYDAEKKAQDQENGLAVKKWFDDLMEAAYDAEDVFHDFAYEVRKRKIENQVQNLCSPYFTAVAQKVRNVTRTLVEISKAMKEFKFVPKENNSTTSDELQRKHREAYPDLVDDSIIVGRVVEKEKILKLLAEDNHSIIAIVGVESIGKSMLAKMVYEDPALTDHFASKLWIPISECSDKFQLLNKGMDRIRRMCLLFGTDHDISYIPTGTYKAMKLRTLNYSVSRVGKEIIKRVPEDLCFKLTFLRVLDLSHSAIRELPSSIGKLKLLSYLDISYTSVTTLPDSLTKLYNLRTLKLKSCCLREFPKEMRKLIGLRHLINSNNRSGQPKMPFELSKLSCLQKLSVFAVSKDSGFGIKELKVLSLLEGKLQIHNLENVSNESGAEDANLKNKTKISHVELYWSKDTGKHTDTASNVLEHLQPPQSLKNLVIHNFPGREFPTWLPANLPKLVSISLVNCYSCQLLPALGKLKSLKVLHLRKMNSVALIDDKFYRDSEEPFSALKELHLSEMSNLKWFNSSSSCFGCLEWLKIDKCTKLNVTPTLFPSLQKFEVSNSIGVAINSLVASNLKTLTSIEITRSVELTSLPHGLLQGNGVLQILEISDCKNFDGILPKQQAHQSQVRHNSSLKSLRIYHCPKLTSLPTVQGWISLHDLRIVDCRRLKFLPDGLQDLSKLEYLHIGGFSEDLECLPDQLQVLTSLQHLILEDFPSLVTLPNWLGNFCFLRKLVIRRCEKLKSLPSEEQMRRLTALQIVQLEQCPLLEDKGLGGESDKLAHIILQRDRPY